MKKIAVAVVTLFLCLSFTGTAAVAQQNFVSIGTGETAGVYYAAGSAICRLMNKGRSKHGIRCSVGKSGGSVGNVAAIRTGEFNFGIVQSDVQYYAAKGLAQFKNSGPDSDLRAVFSIFPEVLTVVSRKEANIRSFEDFKGKRFNIGNPDSGTRETTMALMEALNMKISDFSQVLELNPDEHGIALCDNRIDGFAYVVGSPIANIREPMVACGAKLVPLSGQAVDQLVKERPYLVHATIPGGMYPGNPEATDTFGVVATVVASAKLPAPVVYTMVAAVFDNLEEFKKLHPAFEHLDPKEMIRSGLSAPLHEGALKYYKEKGWM